jgi:hypothetical protein
LATPVVFPCAESHRRSVAAAKIGTRVERSMFCVPPTKTPTGRTALEQEGPKCSNASVGRFARWPPSA